MAVQSGVTEIILQIMSLAYSTIAVGLSINDGRQPGVEYNLDGESVANGVFNAMTAFGTIAFAYGGHNVVLEIQVSEPCALRNQV
jgi:Transmembrane amino acid transporter protein